MAVVEEDDVTQIGDRDATPQTSGKIIHWAFGYDLLLRVIGSAGRELSQEGGRLGGPETRRVGFGCGLWDRDPRNHCQEAGRSERGGREEAGVSRDRDLADREEEDRGALGLPRGTASGLIEIPRT